MGQVTRVHVLAMISVLWLSTVLADEAPISGNVKAVNPVAHTLMIETTSQGKTREVVVHLTPTSRIVRFVRVGTGFEEQRVQLADMKPGWVVSITTRHEDGREVAEVVKIVFER